MPPEPDKPKPKEPKGENTKALQKRVSELEGENTKLRNLVVVLSKRVEILTQQCAMSSANLTIEAAQLMSTARNPNPPPAQPQKEIIRAIPQKTKG